MIALLLCSMTALSGLAAQSPAGGEVQGTVYDSVGKRALAGAVVQIVKAADPGSGALSATTDERGRYVITGIAPGKYIAGFLHAAVDSLALNTPMVAFDVDTGKRVRVDLAIPSARTLVAGFCGRDGAADSTGAVIGVISDARTRAPLDSGSVSASWSEWVIERGGVSGTDQSATGTVRRGGWYLLCGVPSVIEVAVRAWSGSDTTGVSEVSVGIAGLVRLDVFIGGSATLRGTVVSEKRAALPGVRVQALGHARTAMTDSAGRFFLVVPAGTQTIDFRAIGQAPERRHFQLAADGDTTLSVRMTSVKTVLDTIRVVATRVFDRDASGFQKRARMGAGYHFDQARIQRQRPADLFWLLRAVPSVRIVGAGLDKTIHVKRGQFACTPALWMDGMPLNGELLGQVDMLARPEELDAMEVYVGLETPFQFQRGGTCGAIVLWTHRRPRPTQDRASSGRARDGRTVRPPDDSPEADP